MTFCVAVWVWAAPLIDNKRLKQKKPVLSDKCIQSSAITLINNENVISDDFNPFAPCDPT